MEKINKNYIVKFSEFYAELASIKIDCLDNHYLKSHLDATVSKITQMTEAEHIYDDMTLSFEFFLHRLIDLDKVIDSIKLENLIKKTYNLIIEYTSERLKEKINGVNDA